MDVSLDTRGRPRVGPLLILGLFVMSATAACPNPRGTRNRVLTDEALVMNSFPEGSRVTVTCAFGYQNESGSGISTCNGGTWSEADLVCKRKDCGRPKPQPNMTFDLSAGTLFTDTIKVFCNKGYVLYGSSFWQCYPSGWSGRAKCEIVTKDDRVTSKMVTPTSTPPAQGVTKDDRVTSKMVTPTSTPPAQEVPTSTAPPTTPTARWDKTLTASAPWTVSPSAHTGTRNDSIDGLGDTNKNIGDTPIVISAICVSLAFCIVALFLSRFLLGRKGSYDTRGEDLQPELLPIQNL